MDEITQAVIDNDVEMPNHQQRHGEGRATEIVPSGAIECGRVFVPGFVRVTSIVP